MKEIVMNKLGTYSNGLIAFIVLQGIVFSYYFGSNEKFNCIIHTSNYLAESLSILLFLVAIMALYAVKKLGNMEVQLAPEYEDILAKLTAGKMVAVLVFGLLPCTLTLFYGVLGSAPPVCL